MNAPPRGLPAEPAGNPLAPTAPAGATPRTEDAPAGVAEKPASAAAPADGPAAMAPAGREFWRLPLAELTAEEWEALCDGCGRCCLHKLEYEDTGELVFTRVSCHLLDIEACRCTRYADRRRLVPDCLDLRAGFSQFHWLPATCAYRLRHEGRDLPDWHPLISGEADSVHRAGISVRNLALSELEVDDVEDHVIDLPGFIE